MIVPDFCIITTFVDVEARLPALYDHDVLLEEDFLTSGKWLGRICLYHDYPGATHKYGNAYTSPLEGANGRRSSRSKDSWNGGKASKPAWSGLGSGISPACTGSSHTDGRKEREQKVVSRTKWVTHCAHGLGISIILWHVVTSQSWNIILVGNSPFLRR